MAPPVFDGDELPSERLVAYQCGTGPTTNPERGTEGEGGRCLPGPGRLAGRTPGSDPPRRPLRPTVTGGSAPGRRAIVMRRQRVRDAHRDEQRHWRKQC